MQNRRLASYTRQPGAEPARSAAEGGLSTGTRSSAGHGHGRCRCLCAPFSHRLCLSLRRAAQPGAARGHCGEPALRCKKTRGTRRFAASSPAAGAAGAERARRAAPRRAAAAAARCRGQAGTRWPRPGWQRRGERRALRARLSPACFLTSARREGRGFVSPGSL